MKLKLSIILTVLFTGIFVLQSLIILGSVETDSLKTELHKPQSDRETIGLLNILAYRFFQDYEYDSCLKYASRASLLSDRLMNPKRAKNNPEYINICKECKALSLANIGRGLKNHNTPAAIDTLKEAIHLIQETGNKLEEAKIYESIGTIYDFYGKGELALKNHLLSLEAYRQSSDTVRLALQLTNVAVAHRNMGIYGDALEYLLESLNMCREIKDSTNIVQTLLAIGFTYLHVEKWNDALEVQHEALEIYEKMNDSLGIATIYNDMGVVNMNAGNLDLALQQHKAALAIRINSTDYYYTYASYMYIGNIYEELGNYNEAIRNYKSGIKYAKIVGYKIIIIENYLNIGLAYFKLQDHEKAMEQFLQALKLGQDIEDQTSEAQASLNIAKIYLSWDQPFEALKWLQKAEMAAPKSAFIFLEDIYQSIANTYFKLGDYKNAYNNLEIFNQVKDSLAVAENLEKITSLTNRLEFENKKKLQDESHKKMMQIKQKEIQRQKVVKNFSLFGGFVILVLAIIFFIRFIEKKKLNTKLNSTLHNLQATQSQLVHAEKMASLGELTAGIAHEIQNPLNFVKNFSEVNIDLITELKEEIEKGDMAEIIAIADDIATNEEKIVHHGNRAESIVRGMLQHSRKGNNEKESTDINKLAEEYLRLAYHGLRAKDKSFNADFKMNADDSLPNVKVIPQDIGRVLLNLINNAFYAVSERAKQNEKQYKPSVIVCTRKLENKIEICVKDNGNGIPELIKDKIFEPFFTTKPTGHGTGLGLSLSYDIITKGYSGIFKVKSSEGNGTEFIIQLPQSSNT